MKNIARRLFQFSMVFTVFFLAWQHQIYGIEKAAPIDGFCPYGGVVNFIPLLQTGVFLKRIFYSSVILMGITTVLTILFGRVFCGFICPLGAIQEWFRVIGKRLGFKKEKSPPEKVENKLRLLKYMVLILTIILTYTTGTLVFRVYDPYVALMHFGHEFDELTFGYIILFIVMLIAVFYKNFWCRYICPLGGYYGVVSRLRLFKLTRDSETCTDCGMCNDKCPHAIDVQHVKEVKSHDCVSCMECVDNCPVNCLNASVSKRKIKSGNKLGVYVFSLFIGIILLTMATGVWQSAKPSNLGTHEGGFDVAAIRGSNTLQTVMDSTGIQLDYFQKNLGVPKDVDTSMMLKDIGPKYNIEDSEGEPVTTDDFRRVIAKKLGVEYTGDYH